MTPDELKAAIEHLRRQCRINNWPVKDEVALEKMATALQSPATIPGVQETLRMERERCAKLLATDSVDLGGEVMTLSSFEKQITKYFAAAIRNLGDAQ